MKMLRPGRKRYETSKSRIKGGAKRFLDSKYTQAEQIVVKAQYHPSETMPKGAFAKAGVNKGKVKVNRQTMSSILSRLRKYNALYVRDQGGVHVVAPDGTSCKLICI
ncbi:MAG: hypothetical protein JKX85_15725 [Phycisphaeraceae bacterium]|nr:hypothetical protein [Phycisphaeraceae bacterium]